MWHIPRVLAARSAPLVVGQQISKSLGVCEWRLHNLSDSVLSAAAAAAPRPAALSVQPGPADYATLIREFLIALDYRADRYMTV